MTDKKYMPGLLGDSLEFWKSMSADDLEEFYQLPPYMQEHIKRLAYYANRVPELLEATNMALGWHTKRYGEFRTEYLGSTTQSLDEMLSKLHNAINLWETA